MDPRPRGLSAVAGCGAAVMPSPMLEVAAALVQFNFGDKNFGRETMAERSQNRKNSLNTLAGIGVILCLVWLTACSASV